MPLTAAVMSFFRMSDGVLADGNVRQALLKATDTPAIIKSLGYPTMAVKEPLLQGQLAYDPTYSQAGFDLAAAKQQLDNDGWHVGKNGMRSKDGVPLKFRLSTQNSSEYQSVASQLKSQWRAAGADVTVSLQDPTEFQSTLASHGYDALLYGIAIGTDPDVSAYWNSSQANVLSATRLNFSEYHSGTADAALEAGRTRLDPALRTIKYRPFLQAWQTDAPAVGLYQPRVFYVSRGPVFGLTEHTVNNATDRFDNVNNWMIRQKAVSQDTSSAK
jgi:peptide/nickel transport system substrate-binding protein